MHINRILKFEVQETYLASKLNVSIGNKVSSITAINNLISIIEWIKVSQYQTNNSLESSSEKILERNRLFSRWIFPDSVFIFEYFRFML